MSFKNILVALLFLSFLGTSVFASPYYQNFTNSQAVDSSTNTVTTNVSAVDGIYANRSVTGAPPVYAISNATFTDDISKADQLYLNFVFKTNDSGINGNIKCFYCKNKACNATNWTEQYASGVGALPISNTVARANFTNVTNFADSVNYFRCGVFDISGYPVDVSIDAVIMEMVMLDPVVTITAPVDTSTSFVHNNTITFQCDGNVASYLANVTLNNTPIITNIPVQDGVPYSTSYDFTDGDWELGVSCVNGTYTPVNGTSDITFTVDLIDSCRELNTASTTYEMGAATALTGVGACINVTADDITINCQGNTLSGDYNVDGVGINISESSGTQIINCTIRYMGYGIYGYNVNTANFSSNTIYDMNKSGIYLERGRTNNLEFNEIYNTSIGAHIYNQSGDNSSTNNIHNNSVCGMNFTLVTNSRFVNDTLQYNNKVNNSEGGGLCLERSNNNYFESSNLVYNTGQGIYSGLSSGNKFWHIISSYNIGHGYKSVGSLNTEFAIASFYNLNDLEGILLTTHSDDNTIDYTSISGNGRYGLVISDSDGINVTSLVGLTYINDNLKGVYSRSNSVGLFINDTQIGENTEDNIYLDGSVNTDLHYLEIGSVDPLQSGNGINAQATSDIDLRDTIIHNSNDIGLILNGSASTNLLRVEIINSTDYGIKCFDSTMTQYDYGNVSYSGIHGIYIERCTGGEIATVWVHDNVQSGIYVYEDMAGLGIEQSTLLYNNGHYGAYIRDSADVHIYMNTAFWNNTYGDLRINNPTPLNLPLLVMSNVLFYAPDGVSNVSSIGMNSNMYPMTDFTISGDTLVNPTLTGYSAFGNKSINITVNTGTPIIDELTMFWEAAEAVGYTETAFRLYGYNGTWNLLNSTADTAGGTHYFLFYDANPISLYNNLEILYVHASIIYNSSLNYTNYTAYTNYVITANNEITVTDTGAYKIDYNALVPNVLQGIITNLMILLLILALIYLLYRMFFENM